MANLKAIFTKGHFFAMCKNRCVTINLPNGDIVKIQCAPDFGYVILDDNNQVICLPASSLDLFNKDPQRFGNA